MISLSGTELRDDAKAIFPSGEDGDVIAEDGNIIKAARLTHPDLELARKISEMAFRVVFADNPTYFKNKTSD